MIRISSMNLTKQISALNKSVQLFSSKINKKEQKVSLLSQQIIQTTKYFIYVLICYQVMVKKLESSDKTNQ